MLSIAQTGLETGITCFCFPANILIKKDIKMCHKKYATIIMIAKA